MRILYITPEFSGSKSFFMNGSSWRGMPGQKYFFQQVFTGEYEVFIIAQLSGCGAGTWKKEKIEASYFSTKEPNILSRVLYRYFPSTVFPLYYWKVFLKYYKRVKAFNPDIIYGCWTFGAGVGDLFARIFRRPLVVRMFGTGLAKYLPEWDHIRHLLAPYEYFVRTLPFKAKSNALIVTADGTFGDVIAAKLGYPAERVHKLKNGVDFKHGECVDKIEIRKRWNIPTDKFIFTYTGRLEGWKRTDRVLRVFREVHAVAKNLFLVLGGYGLDEQAIQEYAETNNFSKDLLITGPIEHEQVQDILSMSDIHLSLNDLTNLTNTTIEAMASGCCVVALDVGETRDLLINEYNGLLIDLNDVDMLPRVLLDLMKDPEKRELLSKNAVKTIKSDFMTWNERIKLEFELMDALTKKAV
jgi:glycosyltransferase involved in cell wall biosynthesis